jgi:signal transduction histidine kinase
VIEVTDHGIGMSPDEAVRALQPFNQASSVTARTYGGTGLGLPIAKGLVEAHRGTLTIDSSPGNGTSVRLILPRRPTRPAPLGTPALDNGELGVLAALEPAFEAHERVG